MFLLFDNLSDYNIEPQQINMVSTSFLFSFTLVLCCTFLQCTPTMHAQSITNFDSCSVTLSNTPLVYTRCLNLARGGFSIYYNMSSTQLDMTFTAQSIDGTGWIGLGFPETPNRMVISNVVIAFPLSSDPTTTDQSDYALQFYSTSGVQPANNQQLSLLQSSINSTDSLISVRFIRALAVPGLKALSTQSMDLIWAKGRGPVASLTEIPIHTERFSVSGLNLSAVGTSERPHINTKRAHYNAFVAHAVMMSLAWILCSPAAVIFARYLKKYDPLWFQIHRALQIFVFLLVFPAWIVALVYGTRTEPAHLIIGCIVVSLMILQIMNAMIRPDKQSEYRWLWQNIHAWSGRLCIALAWINLFFGLAIFNAATVWYIVVGVNIGFSVVIHLFLEIYFRFNAIDFRPEPTQKFNQEETTESNRSQTDLQLF